MYNPAPVFSFKNSIGHLKALDRTQSFPLVVFPYKQKLYIEAFISIPL